jgi:hypothetical protein
MVQVPQQGPEPDPGHSAIRLVQRLSALDFGATAARIGPLGEIEDPTKHDTHP